MFFVFCFLFVFASTIGLYKQLINKTVFLNFTLNDFVYKMVLGSLLPKGVTRFFFFYQKKITNTYSIYRCREIVLFIPNSLITLKR